MGQGRGDHLTGLIMNGTIVRIKIYPVKGEAGREVPEARLIENLGLEGDRHAKGGERQISLLCTESVAPNQNEQGLCFSRFKENLSITSLEPAAIKPGARLQAGEAVLQITGETKHCHEECGLYEAGKLCSLAGLNLFAKVAQSGVIRVGDVVAVIR